MAIMSLLRSAKLFFTPLVLSALLFANAASAHWSLDNEASVLSFVTVKAEHVAEVHTFDVLSGTIDDAGDVVISIQLASVNTLIPIRNERMQAMLFETNLFPQATITGNVDIQALAKLAAGESQRAQVEIQLSLHGSSSTLMADLMINRTSDGLVATTVKPLIVTADSVGLVAGVEQLREVAGLPSISRSVPVSFTVVFDQGH
ncbi:MAG: YceI family protein [Pseudohongiella sp.]|nr:YceI family protein [Pseudohongiella sp.]